MKRKKPVLKKPKDVWEADNRRTQPLVRLDGSVLFPNSWSKADVATWRKHYKAR